MPTIASTDSLTRADMAPDTLLGEAIIAAGLSCEQAYAGRGTCGRRKVLAEEA